MSIDKLKIRAKKATRPTDPLKVFESRTLRGSVENLWTPQSDALKQWTECRTDPEVIIEMATGGGKTLVGLLAAQAMVNESREKVLYLCSTNQLVRQIAEKAGEVGLAPAVYTSGHWEQREAFQKCEVPCITSYAAAFNAKSKFRREDVHGIVLDDAHVAVPQLRGQFTLGIDRKNPTFKTIANKFRPYFAKTGKAARLDEALSGDPLGALFIPAHVFAPHASSIAALLRKAGVDADDAETKWAWFNIGENLPCCFAVIGAQGMEIAPAVPPVHTVEAYTNARHRLFLTATMPSTLELARVFGIDSKTRVIRPKGKLGAAQKLIVFARGTDPKHHQKQARDLTKRRKACVVVPSYRAADAWKGSVLGSKGAEATLQEFRAATDARKLVLVARFDGIDLPGDSCRILILDGLPRGAHLIERVFTENMRIRSLRASTTATRVVQSIGRIFRSNTDHGVVILCNPALHDWLREPHNQSFLPELLQQQVSLGLELLRLVEEGETTYEELTKALLSNSPKWDDLYNGNVGEFDIEEAPRTDARILSVFLSEHKGYQLLWDERYREAATMLAEGTTNAADLDPGLRGWMHHLTGLAHLLDGSTETANREFQKAYACQKVFGRPLERPGSGESAQDVEAGPQAVRVAKHLTSPERFFRRLSECADALTYETPHAQVEEALRVLGELLGLDASRPDTGKEGGPDVLWISPDRPQGVALEAKTEKKEASQYQKKDDIGQFHDHMQWLTNNYPDHRFFKRIVGRPLPVSPESNPLPDLYITPLEEFRGLVDDLKEAGESALAAAAASDLASAVERGLRNLGLRWPQCVQGLESFRAVDLQGAAPTAGDVP